MPNQDELPEYPLIGPFGGIQSEVAPSQIGSQGFAELQNLLLRKSHMQGMPAMTALAAPSDEHIMGIADFYNINGIRRACVFTPTKMYYWNGSSGTWTHVTGTLTGNTTQFFQWDVVGYKLYFCQQKDIVQVWDGVTAGFSAVTGSVPSKYLLEYDTHLLAANTIESGPTPAPNRIRWSGAGDGTDWTSYSSGQADMFNGLGPVTGLARIYQSAFAWQQWGIVQILLTGIGTAPFEFIPLGSRAKGSILSYGVASFGEVMACYVGKDDVYMFDGTYSTGIGSRPIDGNRRLGARSRIFSDLFSALQSNIFGFILSSANGNTYESYWLFIPSLNKAWVYHFDEGSWTQVYFSTGQLNGPVSDFPLAQVPAIQDLVGSIYAQGWTPSTLTNANQLDTMAISDNGVNSVSYLNFAQAGTNPTYNSIGTNPIRIEDLIGTIADQGWTPDGLNVSDDGWYIRTGPLTFDDPRHVHTAKKVRLMLTDVDQNVVFNLRWTNEDGFSELQSIIVGAGTGGPITYVVGGFSVTGRYLTLEMSGLQAKNVDIVEITPIYSVGGEVACG